jgi:hypothetical protein
MMTRGEEFVLERRTAFFGDQMKRGMNIERPGEFNW